MQMLTNICRW